MNCPKCGKTSRHIAYYNRYYCYQCNEYLRNIRYSIIIVVIFIVLLISSCTVLYYWAVSFSGRPHDAPRGALWAQKFSNNWTVKVTTCSPPVNFKDILFKFYPVNGSFDYFYYEWDPYNKTTKELSFESEFISIIDQNNDGNLSSGDRIILINVENNGIFKKDDVMEIYYKPTKTTITRVVLE